MAMKQSVRKKVSITKLTLARIKYICEHHFCFVSYSMGKRKDIVNANCMHKDTMAIEVGIETLFKAICRLEEIPPEEADKEAIRQYAVSRTRDDRYVAKLADYVELEYEKRELESVTPEDRKKAVEEYRIKKNKEISDEWDVYELEEEDEDESC